MRFLFDRFIGLRPLAWLLVGASLLLGSGALAAEPEWHLEFEVHRARPSGGEPGAATFEIEGWASLSAARLDMGNASFIFQGENEELLRVDHVEKTYQVFRPSFDMVSYLPDPNRKLFDTYLEYLDPQYRLEGPAESEPVGPWACRRYLSTVEFSDGHFSEVEIWLSEDVPPELESFKRLLHAYQGFDFIQADAVRQVLALPGFPVRQVARRSNRSGIARDEQTLVAIEEVPADAARYRPPEGYRETQPSPEILGGVMEAKPRPSD